MRGLQRGDGIQTILKIHLYCWCSLSKANLCLHTHIVDWFGLKCLPWDTYTINPTNPITHSLFLTLLTVCLYVCVYHLWGVCFVLWQLWRTHSITHLYTSQQYVAVKNMHTRTHTLVQVFPLIRDTYPTFFTCLSDILELSLWVFLKSSHAPTIKAEDLRNWELWECSL